MAGQFDLAAARAAGYTDAQIADFVSAQSGYKPADVLAHIGSPPAESGVVDSAREGVADVVGGVGKTLHDYLGPGYVGDHATSIAKAIAPANFVQPKLVGDDGSFHPGNIPARLAQMAPGLAAQLVAAKLGGKFTGGSTIGKIAGAAGAGVGMSAGNEAQTAMDNSTGTPGQTPDSAALARGLGVSAAENAVGAVPLARFVPGVSGKIASTGMAGALDAAKKYTINAGLNAAGSGAADLVHQVGQTAGTPGGVNVNLPEAADATASGLVGGAALGTTGAARDLANAKAYSGASPELMPAMKAVADRAVVAAGDRNLNAGIISGAEAQETGADVFHKVASGIHGELAAAVKSLSTPLSPDAENILNSTKAGRVPTDADYGTVKASLGNDPNATAVLNLMQQAHVLQIIKGTGELSDGSFSGGIGQGIGHHLTPGNILKTALVATIGGEGGHLITYSPEMLGALGAGVAGARLLSNVTGSRAPMGRFVSNFADGTTPVRTAPVAPPAAAPAAPGVGPTGPSIPQAPTPWGPPPPAPALPLSPQARQQMVMQANLPLRALAAQAGPNAMARQAMPALRALAAQAGPNAPSAPNVASVSKMNGKVNVGNDTDEYAMPYSPHADKAPDVAARAFLQDAKTAGVNIKNENGFITGTTRNITSIRQAAQNVAARVPGVSATELAAQFEGVQTREAAIVHRNWFAQHMPQAAGLLNHYFSDAEINKIWKR